MALKAVITKDIMCKTGRDLLPEDIVEYLLEFRNINCWNVVNKKLSEYTWAEWLVCLKEKLLLEQCLPLVSEKLDRDPLVPGLFSKGELLYDVTQIENDFWMEHQEWFEYFRAIVQTILDMIENNTDSIEINHMYVEAYRSFLK